jgi:hypothetical protein
MAPGQPACPQEWTAIPVVDPSIAVPSAGGGVVLHGAATGTQSYACVGAGDAGPPAWSLTGPHAELRDCRGAIVARHFASDAGAGFPEWQAADGSWVVAHKSATHTPGGGAGSVSWVLLAATDHGGTGVLANVTYVQRVGTDGGVAPAGACTAGVTADVPYTADYYFYGTGVVGAGRTSR